MTVPSGCHLCKNCLNLQSCQSYCRRLQCAQPAVPVHQQHGAIHLETHQTNIQIKRSQRPNRGARSRPILQTCIWIATRRQHAATALHQGVVKLLQHVLHGHALSGLQVQHGTALPKEVVQRSQRCVVAWAASAINVILNYFHHAHQVLVLSVFVVQPLRAPLETDCQIPYRNKGKAELTDMHQEGSRRADG